MSIYLFNYSLASIHNQRPCKFIAALKQCIQITDQQFNVNELSRNIGSLKFYDIYDLFLNKHTTQMDFKRKDI